MSFQDKISGIELAHIAQEFRIGMPHYDIFRMGQIAGLLG